MFLGVSTTKPAYVEGRKFVEKTVRSRFEKGDISITTTYMDDRPLLKVYDIFGERFIKNVWKDPSEKSSASLDVLG